MRGGALGVRKDFNWYLAYHLMASRQCSLALAHERHTNPLLSVSVTIFPLLLTHHYKYPGLPVGYKLILHIPRRFFSLLDGLLAEAIYIFLFRTSCVFAGLLAFLLYSTVETFVYTPVDCCVEEAYELSLTKGTPAEGSEELCIGVSFRYASGSLFRSYHEQHDQ